MNLSSTNCTETILETDLLTSVMPDFFKSHIFVHFSSRSIGTNSKILCREIELRHLRSHSYLSFSACAQQTNPMRQQHRHHPLHRHRHQEPNRRHRGQVDEEYVYLTHDVVQFPHIKRDGAVEPLTQEPSVEQSEIRDSQRREEQGHGPAGPHSRHRAQDDQGHAVPERCLFTDLHAIIQDVMQDVTGLPLSHSQADRTEY